MSKYVELFVDHQALFSQAINKTDLERTVTITVLGQNTAKQIFKVVKANDLLKHRTGDDVIIVLNEKVFEQLTDQQKQIVVDEALACIHYDNDKDTLTLSKPDVVTFSGILSKYSFETWDVLRESIKSIYTAEKQAEDEAKAATTKAKGKKKSYAKA